MRTPTKTFLIFLSFSTLVLLSVLIFVLYKIRLQSEEATSLESRAASLSQIDNVAQSVRSIKNSSGADINSLDNLVVSQKKVVSFIEMVESLGGSMNLLTHTLSVNTDETTVRIALETDGSWTRSMDFIQALETLPYKIVLDETTMSYNAESKVWHTNITIALPFFDN